MNIMLFLFAGDKKDIYINFKQRAYGMSNEEFADAYYQTKNIPLRETDLNRKCVTAISSCLVGDSILDVGCGSGYMVERLRRENPDKRVCGTDIAITDEQRTKDYYFDHFAENLISFKDKEFDTVICSHVLEHVLDFNAAVSELRRVAARRLIIVVPKQREYKYTFDLHLRFFPYAYSFLNCMQGRGHCRINGGDIFYIEEMSIDTSD